MSIFTLILARLIRMFVSVNTPFLKRNKYVFLKKQYYFLKSILITFQDKSAKHKQTKKKKQKNLCMGTKIKPPKNSNNRIKQQ